jgi:2-keto-3-deoxy-L-rhamnonate aldolase RhmA
VATCVFSSASWPIPGFWLLSGNSEGIAGQVEGPIVEEHMIRIAQAARSRGLAVGTFVDNAAAAGRWVRAGFQFIFFSVDVGIIHTAMKDAVDTLRSCASE